MHVGNDENHLSESYKISKLSSEFDVLNFYSGISQLDNYIKKYARLNQDINIGQTYILYLCDNNIVIGYYTISAANVTKTDFPTIEKITTELPKYPIPCILIGKLAVDLKYRGRGLGKLLLIDALKRVKNLSSELGCFAVIVDSIESASSFYEKYGFIKFINRKLSYFLPIKTIELAEKSDPN
jgi:predicted GNAT family N-acyltransferase